jgi:DNA repair protein RadC
VFLGSGISGTPLPQLAEHVAEKLREPHVTLKELTSMTGIGPAKACQLLAMIEFVERVRPSGFPVIDQLQKVLSLLGEMKTFQREHIVCLYLNTRLQLLLKETVAVGSVNQSSVTAKDIFSVIKYHPVSCIILAHNHPSGDPSPSLEDFTFTRKIEAACDVLGIELLDHVIVGERGYYSFKEKKKLTHHQ